MDVGLLEKLFADHLPVDLGERNGRRFARLKETDKGAALRQVDVFDVLRASVLVNLDKTDPPHSLFKKGKGKCRRCDYVLITQTRNRHILIFIEMKSARKVPARMSRDSSEARNV